MADNPSDDIAFAETALRRALAPYIGRVVEGMVPMSWTEIAGQPRENVRWVQEWANAMHHFKITQRIGKPLGQPMPEWWLPVWTAGGIAIAQDLTAVDVPIPRLFTFAALVATARPSHGDAP